MSIPKVGLQVDKKSGTVNCAPQKSALILRDFRAALVRVPDFLTASKGAGRVGWIFEYNYSLPRQQSSETTNTRASNHDSLKVLPRS